MAYKNPEHQREASRKHYANNKEYYYERNKRRRQELREWVSSLKEDQPCSICNKSYPPVAMDWHHRNPEEKEFNIGIVTNRNYSKKRILKEIEKCDLICAVCHRVLEFG